MDQVNEENKLGIPVTSYMIDLNKPHVVAKQESQFIKVLIFPLWKSVNLFFDNFLECSIKNIEENMNEWNKLLI